MRWPRSQAPSQDPLPAEPRTITNQSSTSESPGATNSTAPSTLEDSGRTADPDRRPVWLLDVDGVLNANRPGWGSRPAEGFARAADGQFWIRWSPELVRRLIELDRTGAVEIRWATTWVPWISAIEELLGLPSWPGAWEGPFEGTGTPAIPTPLRKVQAALQVVEHERRPLIWTDDDAIPTQGLAHDRITGAGVPCLLVRPSPRAGLQPEDLAAIDKFLRSSLPPAGSPRT